MQEDAERHGRPRLPVRRGQINFSAILATVLGSAILAVAGFIYRGLEEAADTRRQVSSQEKRLSRIEDIQEQILDEVKELRARAGTRPSVHQASQRLPAGPHAP
jgi:hypothetical protein